MTALVSRHRNPGSNNKLCKNTKFKKPKIENVAMQVLRIIIERTNLLYSCNSTLFIKIYSKTNRGDRVPRYGRTADLRVGDYDNFVVVRNCGKPHDATNTTVFDG